MSFHNVCFEVEVPPTKAEKAAGAGKMVKKMIVKNATGYAAPGQATYIMGSSGAGKTSLLNILADRVMVKGRNKITGSILFNDTLPVNSESFAKYASYVMQDDILFSHFTVREAITFAARLKLHGLGEIM